MAQYHKLSIQKLGLDTRLEALFDVLDALHSAASENRLDEACEIDRNQLVGLLQDIVYTAQQTLEEIEQQDGEGVYAPTPEQSLKLVKHPTALKKAE